MYDVVGSRSGGPLPRSRRTRCKAGWAVAVPSPPATVRVRRESCRPSSSPMVRRLARPAARRAAPVLRRSVHTAPDRPDAGATSWWADAPFGRAADGPGPRVCLERHRGECHHRPGARRSVGPGHCDAWWSWLRWPPRRSDPPTLLDLCGQPGVDLGLDPAYGSSAE